MHTASTQHKLSLHQQAMAIHLLLPVVMESILQASNLCVCGGVGVFVGVGVGETKKYVNVCMYEEMCLHVQV